MIPNTGVTTSSAILLELGYAWNGTKQLGALMNDLNKYDTGAYHSANSFNNLQGFTGGTTYHFLTVENIRLFKYLYGFRVVFTLKNNATVDSQSGSLRYTLSTHGLSSGESPLDNNVDQSIHTWSGICPWENKMNGWKDGILNVGPISPNSEEEVSIILDDLCLTDTHWHGVFFPVNTRWLHYFIQSITLPFNFYWRWNNDLPWNETVFTEFNQAGD